MEDIVCAVIRPDGWVVCGRHGKRLARIDAEGLHFWCGRGHREVILDAVTLPKTEK